MGLQRFCFITALSVVCRLLVNYHDDGDDDDDGNGVAVEKRTRVTIMTVAVMLLIKMVAVVGPERWRW